MKKQEDEGLLTKAAKAIGSAAGKVAATIGAAGHTEHAGSGKGKGKLPSKGKSRLPRKEKKAARKSAAKGIKPAKRAARP